MINGNEFKKLNQFENKPAISIFIPTSRAGEEVYNQTNRKRLKSKWDRINREPDIKKFPKEQIEEFDAEIDRLLEDGNFWYHQSDGLALFLGEGFFEYYRLPISFREDYRIADSFYIIPLLPIFSSESPFYLLTLQLEDVHLYEGNEHSIQEIEIEALTPSRIEDRVGYDYKEKDLQFRNLGDSQGATQFHGQGGSERNEKAEIKNYLSAIDHGLQKFLNDKTAPLVVMGQENISSFYRETNSYPHLYEKLVMENPADKEKSELHRAACKALEDYFERNKSRKIEVYQDNDPKLKTGVVHDIVPAAFEGRIDTLFLEKGEELWGHYDESTLKVDIHDSRKVDSISLLNLTAKKVLENNGKAFLLKRAFMPEKKSKMNAVFRY